MEHHVTVTASQTPSGLVRRLGSHLHLVVQHVCRPSNVFCQKILGERPVQMKGNDMCTGLLIVSSTNIASFIFFDCLLHYIQRAL
jgi:hypothetical protein